MAWFDSALSNSAHSHGSVSSTNKRYGAAAESKAGEVHSELKASLNDNAEDAVEDRHVAVLPEPELWTDPHICFTDRGRLCFKAVCYRLRPDVRAATIVAAVAEAARLCGMRVADRDDAMATVLAERLEAPFLASVAKDAARGHGGDDNPHEWRILVGTLGVSQSRGRWGAIDRVLQLRFLTGVVSEAARRRASIVAATTAISAAAAGMVGRVAAAHAAQTAGSTKDGDPAPQEVPPAPPLRPPANPTAFARALSEQRAESLLQTVQAELEAAGATLPQLPGWEDPWPPLAVAATAAADVDVAGSGAGSVGGEEDEEEVPLPVDVDLSSDPGRVLGVGAKDCAETAPAQAPGAEDVFRLVAWGGSSGSSSRSDGDAGGGGGGSSDGYNTPAAPEEVELDLQFVEAACARARGLSLLDARETWRPLERAMSELEGENAALRKLLEPKYRQLGLELPPQPRYSGSGGGASSSGSGSIGGFGAGEAGYAALHASPLFRFRDGCVAAQLARRRPRGTGSAALAPQPGDEGPSHGVLVRAAAALLARVVEGEFEMAAEALVKARIHGAQRYVAALEAHRRALVATVAYARPPKDDSEELQGIFGMSNETLLFSCQAALGRRPGRLYLTHTSLWFHSKLLGMESKYILPLSTVLSLQVLSSPLRISASLVLKTAYLEEVMFVFPGSGTASLEPLAILLRRLLALPHEKGA